MVALSACGGDDRSETDASGSQGPSSGAAGTEDSPRTVEVEMVDNAFEPTEIVVAEGETVQFVFRNEGTMTHDAVIGDEAAQDEHEDEMRSAEDTATSSNEEEMGDMEHGSPSEDGQDEAATTVEPGGEGEITYTFDDQGELLIGCHEPGHYEAGMKINVAVA